MAAKTGTFTLISSNTLGSAASSVTFSSIPQTYTDLRLVINCGTSTNGDGIFIRFNGDTSSIYSDTGLWGTGSSASTGRHVAATSAALSIATGGSTTASSMIALVDFIDYSNTTTYKSFISRAGNATSTASYPATEITVGMRSSTSAITSLTVLSVSNIVVGSTFELYGIEAAK
jgi:hypothetical protein